MSQRPELQRHVLGDRPSTLRNPYTCDIVFYDGETSGLAPEFHDIIEVGALRVRQSDLIVLQEYETKVRMIHPERATAEALRVNGYSTKRWANAVSLSTAMLNVYTMLSNAALCAHKASFDEYFLYHAMKRCSYILYDQPAPWFYTFDTMSNAQLLLRDLAPRLRGTILAEALGITPEPEPHTAMSGARQCFEIYKRQRAIVDDTIVSNRIRELVSQFTTT